MKLKKLNGWWRLWIVCIPFWWAFCIWQHGIQVRELCRIALETGGFRECFNDSLWGWIFIGLIGPLVPILVAFSIRWVVRGFQQSE